MVNERKARPARPAVLRRQRAAIPLLMLVTLMAVGCTADAAGDGAASGEAAGGTRSVDVGAGPVEVPVNPQRVVALDAGTTLPTLLDLGVPVVASSLPKDTSVSTLVDSSELKGVTSIGSPEINLELVAAADPDLIIGFAGAGTAEFADNLPAIAPTLLIKSDRSDWRADAEALAAGIGRERELEKALQDYDDRVETLADKLDSFSGDVSIVRVMLDGVRVHTRFHFSGQVLEKLGLARPPNQQTDDPAKRHIELSYEQLARADADVIFLFGAGGAGVGSSAEEIKASLDRLTSNKIWQQLTAVQSDAVHVVHPLAWQQGGARAANRVLDDIDKVFGG